jgi:multiple sugar transport system permease protein
MYFYRNAFELNNKGYASAIAMFLFCIIMIITAIQMVLQKKWVHYE